jgi:hypothetical protein
MLMKSKYEAKNVTAGFALAIAAAVFVLINGAVWLMVSSLFLMFLPISGFPFVVLGVIGVIFAAAILIGAILVYVFKKEHIGGLIVLIFSILSMGVGGGFFIGFALGVLGAFFILTKR